MIKHTEWIVVGLFLTGTLFATLCRAQEETDSWPREIAISQGVVVIYQPQPEELEGNLLKGRAAVGVELKDSDVPVFGSVWFEARLNTDRSERTAIITELDVTQVRFPDQDEDKAKKLKSLLEKEIPKWDFPIAMDRLLTTLEIEEKRTEARLDIKTDPPKVIFMSEPAVLITIDGKPHMEKTEDSKIERVINTPFTMLYLLSNKAYYLYADVDTWYTAKDIMGDWAVSTSVPKEIVALAPEVEDDPDPEEEEADEEEPGPTPKIIVATEPTELIVTKGKSEFIPISGTDLLYMDNTDSDVLYYIKDQKYYILLSGRWYTAAKLEGPWQYVKGEELPPDFALISEDSEMGTVLYAVPGTDIAEEAVLDAQIPQTAAVERKKATLTVEYDGEPNFQQISGTKMNYAVNTATPVIYSQKKYYACDQAVWFVSESSKGPWSVASAIPDEIYTIPPECPIYNVTYVHIYQSTPDVVYVGYLPGYTNTYVYHTTIVYGTGYYYPGWYGRYYYPRPSTWGFHVRWNPWTGWSFGLSYSYGPFRFTIGGGGWYRGGWWGPGRYRGYNRGYRHGYRHGRRAGYRAGYRAGKRDSAKQNIYRNQRNKARTMDSPAAKKGAMAGNMKKRDNNVFADKNGNVHRKTDQGWQTHTKDGWQSQKGEMSQTQRSDARQTQTQRPQQQPQKKDISSGSRTTTQQLDRSNQARQRGDQRTKSYNKSRNRSGSRSGGRSMGGGGGRR